MNHDRLKKLRENMSSHGLDQIVITAPSSICYLTGIFVDPGERLLALYVGTGTVRLLVNELFTVEEQPGIDLVRFGDTEDGAAVLSGFVMSDKPLGIDKDMAARFLIRLMELKAAPAYVNASECIDLVRGRKDSDEIALMRTVSVMNDRAMEELRGYIAPGITEEGLAEVLKRLYGELGADGVSFEPLIAFGPNAAAGHHSPDGTKLREGDCVLIDVGCKKDGYCADMTRTYFCRSAVDRMKKVYETVKAAGDAAERMIKPGVRLSDIDKAARDIITNAGFGTYFTHRLGHFIGMDVHEYGDVSSANTNPAEPGMIFSVEPGIYLPGEGGVRIEDLVLVTESGCETLNHVSRELTVL